VRVLRLGDGGRDEMNPAEYYRLKTATITDKEVALVAACMTDHIGEENAVRIERLAARVAMGERQVRDILETLVCDYGWPIGAHAGRAGRWIIASEEERWKVLGDLDSRQKALYTRRNALLTAKVPNTLELNRAAAQTMQTGLF
jgi:hypothetical protein